jgi:hypothetical protein
VGCQAPNLPNAVERWASIERGLSVLIDGIFLCVGCVQGPGLPVPDSEFGSYESWGQPGSTSVGPQTRRDESSTQST